MIQENQQNCESSLIHLDNEDIEILSYNFTKKSINDFIKNPISIKNNSKN